ncbi:Uncharacterized protein HZ326_30468 [Fusarium oxysporum f. sp. albedinis]|nr:Uncharacterized protein HZ326_30468 [Fusarium oxysporum f. sp. albedinis]
MERRYCTKVELNPAALCHFRPCQPRQPQDFPTFSRKITLDSTLSVRAHWNVNQVQQKQPLVYPFFICAFLPFTLLLHHFHFLL